MLPLLLPKYIHDKLRLMSSEFSFQDLNESFKLYNEGSLCNSNGR